MGLRNLTEIDLIVRMPGEPARAALVIYDGGEVPEPAEREGALQKKLAAYLEFVVSGQFRQAYPELSEHTPCIEVVCLQPPTDGMAQIKSIRDSAGACLIPVTITPDGDFRAKFPPTL